MSILSFLEQFRVNSGKFTHVGWYPTKGKFNIPNDKIDEFWDIYSKDISKGETCGLVEHHEKIGPVLIDIDIKYELDDGYNRKYKFDDIKKIVRLYNEQLRDHFDIINENDLTTYVFEKPSPTKTNGNMKDGFHIMYPNIVSEPDVQYEIREFVVEYLNKNDIFHHWNAKNKVEDIIDKCVIESNGWILYGSSKIMQKPYVLTHILDNKLNELYTFPEITTMPKMFSIRNKQCETKLSNKSLDMRKNRIIKNTVNKENAMIYKSPIDSSDVNLAKKLVSILTTERANDYSSWLDVGFCLFNIDQNLLSYWIEFSKKSSKYRDGECENLWKTFKHKGLSIGSLHRWAMIDNREEYMKIVHDGTRELLMESLSGTNFDVANVLYTMFKFNYVCASSKHNTWFEYRGHRWYEIEGGMSLKQKISPILSQKYRQLQHWYATKMLDNTDETKKKQLEEKMEAAKKLVKHVKETTFKNKIMSECQELFYDPNFYNKLDSRPHLIGFENGVYDLDICEFRDGCPEDYISFSTNCDYVEYDQFSSKVKEVENFISEVLTDNEKREYVLNLLASWLNGKCFDQKFHFWTGTGANGKSTFVELFEDSFGDYASSASHSILTRPKGNSSNANPEIAKLKGVRFVHMQEPEQDDTIHAGHMKEMSGGDKIQARQLYKAPFEFKPQFKMVMACNELPSFGGTTDGGTWRRVRVCSFESKFVDNPIQPNEFKKDSQLTDKMETWHEAMMSLLIKYYKTLKANNYKIYEPECVLQVTREYQKNSDILFDYFEENITYNTEDKKSRVTITHLYTHFCEWYKASYGSKGLKTRKDVKQYMIKKYGDMKSNGWIGLKFRDDEE